MIGSWGRENFNINVRGGTQNRVQVEGWLHRDAAGTLFNDAGLSFDSLKAVAATREVTPVSLGTTVSFALENTVRQVASRNVAAKLEGGDPSLNDE